MPMPRRCGEDHTNSKLNAVSAAAIRNVYATGFVSMAQLGRWFSVDTTTVLHIVQGKIWKHAL